MLASVSEDERRRRSLDQVVASARGDMPKMIAIAAVVIELKKRQIQEQLQAQKKRSA